jgi:hypothetical protein
MPTFVGMTRRHGPRVDLNADWYYLFNHIDAKVKGIGPFTFDDSSPPTDYYLVERLSVKSREATFALYKASQPELVGQKIS